MNDPIITDTSSQLKDIAQQKKVYIDFPEDPKELAKVLDWMYNDHGFASIYMAEDIRLKSIKAGVKVFMSPLNKKV